MTELLRIFIKVADCGSFSAAARQLRLAPSSVSRKIDQLEQQLCATLLIRSTRQITLTDKGRLFLAGARQNLAQWDNLVGTLRQPSNSPRGHLKISAFESFGRLHLSPLLPAFLRRHPQVQITFELDNRMVDLATEDVDIAIRIGQPRDSSLRARKLLSNHCRLCAAPDYLNHAGSPASPEALTAHNCLLLTPRRQQSYWYFRRTDERQKIAVTGNLASTGGTPLLEAAEQGAGLLLLPHWMLSASLAMERLVPVLDDWQASPVDAPDAGIYAVFQNNKYMEPALRLFIDFLVEQLPLRGLAN